MPLAVTDKDVIPVDMKNLEQLMEMGRELQNKMTGLEESLATREVSASAGGGMVTATVTGKGKLKGVKIDQTVVDPSDIEMLEDLVLAAVSEAQAKAQSELEEEMKKMSGGLPLPGGGLPGLF